MPLERRILKWVDSHTPLHSERQLRPGAQWL